MYPHTNGLGIYGGGAIGMSNGNAVQKTGDTMTGQLVIKGDQFDQNMGAAVPALLLENTAGGDGVGMVIGAFGDSVNFVKANGAQAYLRMGAGTYIQLSSSTDGYLQINTNNPGGNIHFATGGGSYSLSIDPATEDLVIQTANSGQGIQFQNQGSNTTTRFHLSADGAGDLIASCTVGTNAGKSVNLTSGKWA